MVEIWCDVGGTFTDTLVSWIDRDGIQKRERLKVLSSGLTNAPLTAWLDDQTCKTQVPGSVPNFWHGSQVAFRDATGNLLYQTSVVSSSIDGQNLSFDRVIDARVRSQTHSIDIDACIEAPVLAAHYVLGIPLSDDLPKSIDVRLGTTRGTNALLTRSGNATGLLITDPFTDLLLIGHQDRPDLFKLSVVKRPPLYTKAVGVPERILADGSIEKPIDLDAVRQSLEQFQVDGITSVAISFLNAYANPEHEAQAAKIARAMGFLNVSVSHEISPVAKWVDRTETTVVDAYLGPTVRRYLASLHRQFGGHDGIRLRVMTSAGGLVDFRDYGGKDSVLSGPAGGVVALQRLATAIKNDSNLASCIDSSVSKDEDSRQLQKLIGLDMGGTSTDVCRIAGPSELKFETVKASVRLLVPSLDIQTVASGGGSICSFDGVQWNVGPSSAGAKPGPACYGRGGPLTVTDLNLLTGRLPSIALPFPIDSAAARSALNEQCKLAGLPITDDAAITLADGLRRIANEQMAAAVRSITIAEGVEPRDHLLVGFGGAAGQHICQIADLLNIPMVLDPLDAGILSAIGMGLASITRTAGQSIYEKVANVKDLDLETAAASLRNGLAADISTEGFDIASIKFECVVEVRTQGTDRSLSLPWRSTAAIFETFHRLHRQRFGYSRLDLPLEITAVRVIASVESNGRWACPISSDLDKILESKKTNPKPTSPSGHKIYSDDQWIDCQLINRDDLAVGQQIDGPAIITSSSHTMVLEDHWIALVCNDRSILAKRMASNIERRTSTSVRENESSLAISETQQQVFREVLAQRFAAIASQMGIVLELTAISVNIRDRRDFSCAVFDRNGFLLANAPHVPVHLGAMQVTVQNAISAFPNMQRGDSFITNDPFCGGSHLPDVTVIAPVFVPDRQEVAFFVANRAHHAEIGGIAPGSMTPRATRLVEEGVVLPIMYLARQGQDESDAVAALLSNADYPSRLVPQNMSDLAAQSAANQRGLNALEELINELGWKAVADTIDDVVGVTETKVRRWIESKSPWKTKFADMLDDGTPIVVSLEFIGDRLIIDFEGTGPISETNFNASPGIVNAAVLYVIRCAIDDTLPMNSGALRPIDLRIPLGILNPITDQPLEQRPAVGAGNVETSQRIVDVLLGALGMCAASQGTMNNLLLGDKDFGFYETLAGGTGATSTANGADAVHSHMTNTRLTDPEVMEQRYPLRIRQLAIRRGSGGQGERCGGDGMVREIEVLKPLEVSLITSRRPPMAPYGILGGEAGMPGINSLIRQTGQTESLPASIQISVQPGERVRVETPGGGGFGTKSSK